MSYPASITPFVRRLQAHSTNTFKIEPSGARSSLGAGQVVSFSLPSNSLLSLKSIRWMFNAKITSANDRGRLPNKIASLVERYSVEAGGVVIYQGHLGYNVVKHAKDAMEMGNCEEVSRAVQNHEDIPRLTGVDNADISAANEAPSDSGDATQFCVGGCGDEWLGFMEAKPEILDTSLLPELTLKLYLAPNAVCTDSDGTDLKGGTAPFTDAAASPAPVYQINNQRLLCTTYSVNDGMYDMMIEQRIKDNGFIEVPFKQYFTYFDGAHSGSTRFNIGTQSLDRVSAVWRPTAYATPGAPVLVSGMKDNAGAPSAGNQLENSAHAGEKYVSKYFNFAKPSGITGAQFQLNGTLYPQFLATPDEWFQVSKDSANKKANAVKSLQAWNDNYHIYSVRLNQPDADELRLISGLDTRSMNLAGYLNSQNAGSTAAVVICECTSTLRIGANMQLSVVV